MSTPEMTSNKLKWREIEDDESKELLKTQFHPMYKFDWIQIEGCCMRREYLKIADDVLNFEIKDDDIWICTYPKSGTTWAQEMIWCIGNDVDLAKAKQIPLRQRFPILEAEAILDFDKYDEQAPEGAPKTPPGLKNSIQYVKNFKGQRFVKTHMPLQLLPRGLATAQRKAKLVYVARDHRDVCVSYYFYHRYLYGYLGDISTFLKLFLDDKVQWSPYWRHVLDIWNIRDQPNLLLITYEEMKADLPAVIRKVAGFLGKELTPEQVNALEQHLSFESMKNNPMVNFEDIAAITNVMNANDGRFMRVGKSGAFGDSLTEDQIRQLNDWGKRHLEGSDYVIPVHK